MNNIKKAFYNKKALIPFITCGDPDLDTTKKLVCAMEEAGADLIELGIPFSDPTAEGSVIQEANIRALQNHITTDDIFTMVKELRKTVKLPLVFVTYANVVFSYGAEPFMKKCGEIGIDGLILTDIPYEEKEEFNGICERYGIELISMIAPTSRDRIHKIAKEAEGFLYCLSSSGTLETREGSTDNMAGMIQQAKADKDIPCAVEAAASTPQQAKEIAEYADGIILGSAVNEICAEYGRDAVSHVVDLVREMKRAVRDTV